MKLSYITIMVRNIDKSLEFYKELVELNVIREINPELGKIRFLSNDKDETMIELIEFEKSEKVCTKGLVLSFETKDLDSIRNKAISMGYETSEIIDISPKPKHFTVKDPDGITIEFSL